MTQHVSVRLLTSDLDTSEIVDPTYAAMVDTG